jgi:H+-translocating NAD(P) transhydrogenase subunit alpha
VKSVTVISGKVAALDRANVDTDQIIPKQFLKRVERTGFGEFLFWDWFRQPGFPLNRIEFHGAPILAAGRNFGSGSSREHAPWALQDYGYEAIVAPSFSDIFYSNCTKIGLLPVELPDADVRELIASAPAPATIDLEAQTVMLPSGRASRFEIDAEIKQRLLNGWDEIALTENRVAEIERFETTRERVGPDTRTLGAERFRVAPAPPASSIAPMRIGVPSEHGQIERRVALTPDAVARLLPLGVEVLAQAGAGVAAALPDGDYTEAGARIVPDGEALLAEADLVVMVTRPRVEDVPSFRSGTAVVGMLQPLVNRELVDALAAAGVTSFSLDAIPRITRSQSMDALSSQATVSGYKAVLMSAELLPKFFPMLMTAAGTVAPAKVFVLGAGVAGLQALATARRLGAVVSAFDTRPVVREQVESLGASFVELQLDVEEGEDARGYARELSEAQYAQQQELVARTVADSDVVITTALIPGRPAPRLITAASVADMRPGSVIVDLAAEAGGNCELTVPGEVVVREGVTIVGTLNLPSTMPLHASQMYARNITNLLGLIIADGELKLDFEDEIVADACITHEGRIVSRLLQGAST